MTREQIIDFAKSAYLWGVDNGSNRSDKNFNDFIQTPLAYAIIALDEQVDINEECQQCGNKSKKELHCPECGNNFPI
jgi:hypothetical protein